MAVLQKVRVLGNERLDLTDFENLQMFLCADFDQLFKRLWNSTTQVVRGFRVFQDAALTNPKPTVSPVYVELEGAVLLHTNLENGPLFYVGAEGTAPAKINLTANALNYIEAELATSTGSPDTRTFWDPTHDNGPGKDKGIEFAQVIDTVTNLDSIISVNTAGWTGGTKVPIALVELDGGGAIVGFYDKRNLFYRLSRETPFDDDFQFPFSGGRHESVHTLTLDDGGPNTGVFVDGEVVTIGPATARVVSGGTTEITITAKDQETLVIGDTVIGSTSAASRTLLRAVEDFNSADKSIESLKDLLDALMTEIVRMKFGTTALQHYWFEDAVTSLADARPELFIDGGGTISWDSGTGHLSFSADLTIPITHTLFTNTIQQSTQSPITLSASGMVAYIDVNHGANANLTVQTALQSNYEPKQDRFIIARRIGTSVEVEDRLQ